ncbi:hypothetical protein DFH94DRAFT_686377 [Russula ochroleuca]|uniref:Uncharacterized protein n=1 Tax=Russula ochroleuca TaxID=152965 RepID=A0A9P5MMX7_9AGAM|nr:hypothetical protein DFH94DRAFT_686377 [Russula ochroleuca]
MIILQQRNARNNPSLLFSTCGPCIGDGSRLWHDMIRSPLPLPSVGTYAQRCAWWILSTSTLDLLPAPEAFGTVQSVAGARAEGHPVRVMSGSHRLSPVPWGRPWVYVLSGSLCKGDNMLFDFVSSLSSLSLDFRVIYLSSLPPRWIISSNLPDLPSCQVLKVTIVG